MTPRRQLIESFYNAWVARDWGLVERSLTSDFHFRSPVDDFTGVETYHSKCWPAGEGSRRFTIQHYMEDGDAAFLIYTWESVRPTIRAAEHVRFEGGRIQSIDCYWGFVP